MRGKSAELIEKTLQELKENGVDYSWDEMRSLTQSASQIEAESRMIPDILFLRNASLLLNSKYAEQEDMEKLFGDTKIVGEQVTDREILDASIGKSKSELGYEYGMKFLLESFKDTQKRHQYTSRVTAKLYEMPAPETDKESAEIIRDYVEKNLETMDDTTCRSFTGMGKNETIRLLNENADTLTNAIETNLRNGATASYLTHTARRCLAIEAIEKETKRISKNSQTFERF